MLGLTQTVSEYIALEWLNTLSSLSLLNETQNEESLILLFRFIIFTFFFQMLPNLVLTFQQLLQTAD